MLGKSKDKSNRHFKVQILMIFFLSMVIDIGMRYKHDPKVFFLDTLNVYLPNISTTVAYNNAHSFML